MIYLAEIFQKNIKTIVVNQPKSKKELSKNCDVVMNDFWSYENFKTN